MVINRALKNLERLHRLQHSRVRRSASHNGVHQHAPAAAEEVSLEPAQVDRDWKAMSRTGLKVYLKKKGVSQELVGAVLSAEGLKQRAAVIAFAKAVDSGSAGVADIASLATALGLADPWRNSREFMIKTKGAPKAAAKSAPVPVLPTAEKSLWKAPVYTTSTASAPAAAAPTDESKPTSPKANSTMTPFDFFEQFDYGIP
mmetsp:Transcript_13776/g.30348  ORF Transcript_13776/g.30348 Transcript_13776/m.30348 type:complete len:201 (-) Transcript_13776:49-651(-)